MKEHWDSADLHREDREEALRAVLWTSVVRIEVDHHVGIDEMRTQMTLSNLGALGLLTVESTGATIRRTPKLIKDDTEPAVFLGLQVVGTSIVIQDGKQAVLHAGEFALYDTSTPYTLLFDGGLHQHFLRIPRSQLALPESMIRAASAVTLGTNHPVAELTANYLSGLIANEDLRAGAFAESLAQPTIDLVRAVITTRSANITASAGPLHRTLALRIMEYVRLHLADPALSAETIAAAHNISVRHLYATLAKIDVSLGDWVRARRLEECRKELSRAQNSNRTIAEMAARWGFADGAHFSRSFKNAYGVSPREWRRVTRGQ